MVNIFVYCLLVAGAVGIAFTTAQVLLAAALLCGGSSRRLKGSNSSGTSARRSDGDFKDERPRVSIIKPVSGIEDGLEMNLESFANLAGPSYELIISVADPDDPPIPTINNATPLFKQGTLL